MIQGTRPQTAAPGLNDSPAGLAAWIVEKFQEWSDFKETSNSAFRKTNPHARDDLLADGNHRLVLQPYRDYIKAGAGRWTIEGAKAWIGSGKTPTGVALFPADIATPPREWAGAFIR